MMTPTNCLIAHGGDVFQNLSADSMGLTSFQAWNAWLTQENVRTALQRGDRWAFAILYCLRCNFIALQKGDVQERALFNVIAHDDAKLTIGDAASFISLC